MSSGESERVPALDGLRGLAVLMVLAVHLIPYRHATTHIGQILNGIAGLGWAGVDLFFVLSGFLITGILINARTSARYFRNFYARRTLRIFPLYYLLVFLAAVPGPVFFSNVGVRPSIWLGWWWLYLSNVPYAFMPLAEFGWLRGFWSLAVEEHFYLVWPTVVLICSDRSLVRVCTALVCCAWLCRAACDHFGLFHAGYSLTPCRMDALAYGGLVAVAVRSKRFHRFGTTALALSAGLALAAMLLLLWKRSVVWCSATQLVTMPLLDMLFALWIFAIGTSGPQAFILLRMRWLRLFGKYSYGIYVFHEPIASVIGPRVIALTANITPVQRVNDLCGALVLAGSACAVAVISWHLFEKPFISLKRFFPQSNAIPARAEATNESQPLALPT